MIASSAARAHNRAQRVPTVGFSNPDVGHTVAAFDPLSLRIDRLHRLQREIRRLDYGGAVFFDPINVRFATGSRSMSVWLLHNLARYCFVPAVGKPILYEFPNANCLSLAQGNEVLGEVRGAIAHLYTMAAEHRDKVAAIWASDLSDSLVRFSGSNKRLAIDRLDPAGFHALSKIGITVYDGLEVVEQARLIKSVAEIALIRQAVHVAEQGIVRMQEHLRPGISENGLWANLHATNIEAGGEWMETRLLSSGPRTNPWYQECSDRVIDDGDIVCLDTDLVGPHGYCADISRAFLCGPQRPSNRQNELYQLAFEQIQHNAALLRAGVGYIELAERAWIIPEQYRRQQYGMVAHGVGLADEGPVISYDPRNSLAPRGELHSGMCISVESYIGVVDGSEGVKLEQQYVITDSGAECLAEQSLPEVLEVF